MKYQGYELSFRQYSHTVMMMKLSIKSHRAARFTFSVKNENNNTTSSPFYASLSLSSFKRSFQLPTYCLLMQTRADTCRLPTPYTMSKTHTTRWGKNLTMNGRTTTTTVNYCLTYTLLLPPFNREQRDG